MARFGLRHLRLLLAADRHGMGTAGMEAAARRGMQRGGNIAGEALPPAAAAPRWMRRRHGGDQRLGIRVQRIGLQRALVSKLDNFAQIHHRHAR